MTKHERLFSTLAGESVDRTAISIWRHFYSEETTSDGLASAMLEFQKKFDWDFMKVNPRFSYQVEDWGNTYEFSKSPLKKHVPKEHRIKESSDWEALEPLSPETGVLGQHLESLRKIDRELNGTVPYIMTIFNPISIAGNLAGGSENLLEHLQKTPEAVHAGLKIITETVIRFARACLDIGTTGIFFPTTDYASSDVMTTEQYQEFGRAYDLAFLKTVQDAKFLLLHVCKSNCFLFDLLDYPVHAINWSTQDPTNPSLLDAADKTNLTLIGGLDHGETVCAKSPESALSQSLQAIEAMNEKSFILGAGCTVPCRVNDEILYALRQQVEAN